MQIYHNSQNLRYRQPFGAVTCGETVTLNIYAPGCEGASVRFWQDQSGETMIPMNRSAALFSAKIKMPENPCILWYFFVLNYGNKVVCYGNNPESLGGEGCVYEGSQPPSFQITVHNSFKTPSWYKNGLVYQIFPDRFARGADFGERKAAAQLPEGWQGASRFFEEDWHTLPYYIKNDDGAVTDWQFFGGTLNGIREKIPYLKSLGVTALYLNPIFRASSNHRYDTADYMQVDPLLGDNEIFQRLAEECRKHDIRIILDGVFSHTGADSLYFDKFENYKNFVIKKPEDPKETGAWLSEDSKYRNWYRFKEEAPGYECWWGVTDLPNVEEMDPSYDRYICGPEGVLENWMDLGASGFRLDVADELPDSFIRNIRDTLKRKDSDNLLIGEVWEDASNKYSYGQLRRYFAGDELDGTMNYPFRDNAINYCIGKESAEMFCRKMRSLQENYPAEAFYGSLNIVGGHDCERILSVLGSYTRAKEDHYRHDGRFIPQGAAIDLNGDQYAQAKARLKMLSSLQYTMPGVPCVYYGDEVGVQGSKDPDNRRTYPWEREDQDLLYHYRMLGLIYQSHPVLKDGAFEILDKEGCLFVIRANEEETILTIVNPTFEKKVFSETFKTLFSSTYKNRKFVYGLELLKSEEITITETALETSVEPLSSQIILLKEEIPERLVLPAASGILCHLSSLPEIENKENPNQTDKTDKPDNQIRFAGALGKRGRAFVDWLAESGFKLWQILPVNPAGAGNSPYFSPCVFAGETRYIDPDELPDENGFDEFCFDNQYWLSDWAEYVIENNYMNYVTCHKNGLKETMLHDIRYDQYVFFTQLKKLKEYANSKGIALIGDLAIYATPQSADLKAHPEYFQVDENGRLLNTGGVPPDYFSETGQNWSNPLYNWKAMEKDDYEWWYQRFRLAIKCFDYIRLDHFRSFSAYYAIPEGELPKEGSWQQGPGMKFFYRMKERLKDLPIIAEDLGLLDSDVFNLLKLSGFPGMNIWQFSAEEMKAMNKKEAQSRVFYSGTHDNQTLVGWCADNYPEADPKEKAHAIIEELMNSEAPWVIFQLQDILLLDDSARINIPGTVGNNWLWHCTEPLPEIRMFR
ncbi:MAG TPA: hypothetical protein GX736_00805 [Mogibacterium sp.]|nr:hypothetical protein [Mogibacterium sp.]